MTECTFRGTVKEHRVFHGLGRNATATRASMGGRTLSYVEDGTMRATPAILDRIHSAIDSLAGSEEREAG